MPNGERVVLRTPWPVVLVYVVPALVCLLITVVFDGWWWGFVIFSAAFVGATVAQRRGVAVTPAGLLIRRFPSQLLPWNHVGAIASSSVLGSRSVTVWDMTENRIRRLPAPQSFLRLGSGEVAAAQALVEQWWIAHRGPAPVVTAPSRFVQPGPPGNPYAPPPGS